MALWNTRVSPCISIMPLMVSVSPTPQPSAQVGIRSYRRTNTDHDLAVVGAQTDAARSEHPDILGLVAVGVSDHDAVNAPGCFCRHWNR